MNKHIYFLILASLTIFSGCSKNSGDNAHSESEVSHSQDTTKANEENELTKNKKIGFDSNSIKELGLDKFAKRKYEVTNEYDSFFTDYPIRIEVFKSFPIEFALYTKRDNQFPSAVLVYSSIRLANSTVEDHYKELENTIEGLIPADSKKYVAKQNKTIEDQEYTSYIFDKEFSSDDVLKPITTIMHAKNQDLKNKLDEGSSKAKSEFEERAKLPAEFSNALIKAEQYLKSTSFSKQKLYDQLIFEKYSNEAADYAVENIKTNWNEQALKKAKSYQESMAMSTESIRDQLTSEHGEKFTPEEAEYAIQNLGQ